MGRPKLYHTELERKRARARWNDEYYEKNVKRILKQKRRYHRHKKHEIESKSKPAAVSSNQPSAATQDPVVTTSTHNTFMEGEISRKPTPEQSCQRGLDTCYKELEQLHGGSVKLWCAALYARAIANADVHVNGLDMAVHDVEAIHAAALGHTSTLYSARGVSKAYKLAVARCDVICDARDAVGQLWEACYEPDMAERHKRGQFRYLKMA